MCLMLACFIYLLLIEDDARSCKLHKRSSLVDFDKFFFKAFSGKPRTEKIIWAFVYFIFVCSSFIYTRHSLEIPLLNRILLFLKEESHKPRAECTWDLIYMHERVFGDTTYCVFCKHGILEDRKESERKTPQICGDRETSFNTSR